MRIVWNENPLKTQVYLDAQDLKLFKIAIQYEEAFNTLMDISFRLNADQIEEAKRTLSKFFDRDNEDDRIELYINELLGTHCGDCICVPASCVKCYAEDLLGINTIEGLGKHVANKIVGAFANNRNIDQALEYLKNYVPDAGDRMKELYPDTWKQWEEKWKADADQAYVWLLEYKKTKLNPNPEDIDWEEVATKARGL